MWNLNWGQFGQLDRCLNIGKQLHLFFFKSQLCILSPVLPTPFLSPPPPLKVLTVGQFISAFMDKRLSFHVSEAHICFLENTCHWISFNLTFNSILNNPFSAKAAFNLLKVTKQKPPLPSLHFLLSCSVILRSFSPLSLSSFPQLSAASSPSRHSPHRAAGKDPFAELSLEDFL